MKIGMFFLVLGYMLSQFYRAFLAVLAPALTHDLGAAPADLSLASGFWFLTFALMQLPVGWALDRLGPRRTVSSILAFGGGGGALLLAGASAPWHVIAAMALLGVGCAPVLMASYYIFARSFPVAMFSTLGGAMIGIGSLGNLAASLPMTWLAQALGWRETMVALAGVTLLVALALYLFVKDPPKPAHEADTRGSVFDLLKLRALWVIFPMMFANYAAAAGIRGLWIGPYLSDVFAASPTRIGQATLIMGLGMIAGVFAYGPLDRLFRTRKWVVFFGNLMGGLAALALYLFPAANIWLSVGLMAAIGFFGSSFPVLMAHARAFIPTHLTGRGVTLLNLFGIGGAGLMQSYSGHLQATVAAHSSGIAASYGALFLFFGAAILIGCFFYLFSRDRAD